MPWLATTDEQVLNLTVNSFTHFGNVLDVQGTTVRMLRRPEELVFVRAKTTSPTVAPWLRH